MSGDGGAHQQDRKEKATLVLWSGIDALAFPQQTTLDSGHIMRVVDLPRQRHDIPAGNA